MQKLSQKYFDNWMRSNRWLQTRAPDYVLENIQELSDRYLEMTEEYIVVSKQYETYLEDSTSCIQAATARIKKRNDDFMRIRWYHWLFPPIVAFKLLIRLLERTL